MYHHVSAHGGQHCISPARLREQLGWLRREGYSILTGREFEAFAGGHWQPDRRSVVLTFDDGWLDNWCEALPILEEFSAPAIFFVVTSWPGAGDARHDLRGSNWKAPDHGEAMQLSAGDRRDEAVMRWSELLAARNTGLVELHSHSHAHGSWWQSAESDVLAHAQDDIRRSIEELRTRTGIAPTQFCWPRGEFTMDLRAMALRLGFAIQHSTLRGINEAGLARQRVVRRIHVEDRGLDWFSARVRLYSRPKSGEDTRRHGPGREGSAGPPGGSWSDLALLRNQLGLDRR
jgi:peptidoglycan/xylan/chitin deacetylase (PgdA/CDA1 family)